MSAHKLPMTCGDVTLISLGKLDPDAPGSHDEDYIYPIGFKTLRKHASATNPSFKCQYHSEITVGPKGKPQFKVTCADMSEHPYEDSTPNGAWSLVFEAIASCTRRSSRGGGAQIAEKKGWDLFGLNSDRIKKMLMEMEGVEQCTKLRYNKERAAREAKEQHKLEEEEEREDRERDKKRKEKMPKAKKGRSSEYQQPPMLEQLKPGQWRCMEDDMEVVPGSSEEQVAVDESIPEGEPRQREQLHRIWELAAVQQFLRSFRSVLGVSPLTSEDFHTAFLECSSALKVIHLRLMMPANDRKRAPEMAEGDGWLDILRDTLRAEREVFNEDSQENETLEPAWTKFLDKDPMPESIHQYFELTLRERAVILWWLCENLLDCEEEGRDIQVGKLDWEMSADALRYEPNAFDKDGNSYWYFEGSSGVLYKEAQPKSSGRKIKPSEWQPISRSHEDLAEVGSTLQQEGKKRKLPELQEFASWIVDSEAPKLQSKEQAKERAKSKAALLEMLPRKRSSRVATKEEREKEEEEKKKQREEELAYRKAEEERKRKEKEKQQHEKNRQQELAKIAKEEERQKQFKEAERERRLRKRRRLLAKQAQQAAAAEALDGAEDCNEPEGEWWEIGNHVEVYSEDDWWQAVILKNKTGPNKGDMQIYVAYIGGSEDDNEWLPTTSVRVRPPTDSFWDQDGDSSDDELSSPQPTSGVSLERKRGGSSNGAAKEQKTNEKVRAGNGTSSHTAAKGAPQSKDDLGLLLPALAQAECKPEQVKQEQKFQPLPVLQQLSTVQQRSPQQLPTLQQQMRPSQQVMPPVQNLAYPAQNAQMQEMQRMQHMQQQQHLHQQQQQHMQLQQNHHLQQPQQHHRMLPSMQQLHYDQHQQQRQYAHQSKTTPSQQGGFNNMSMSNVVDKQPHIHGASLMHSQAHLASMAPAPSNRPTSGEGLNGLLNADGAIPHTMQAGPVSGGGSHGAAPGLGMRDEDAGGFGNMPLANGTRNGYGYGGNLSQ